MTQATERRRGSRSPCPSSPGAQKPHGQAVGRASSSWGSLPAPPVPLALGVSISVSIITRPLTNSSLDLGCPDSPGIGQPKILNQSAKTLQIRFIHRSLAMDISSQRLPPSLRGPPSGGMWGQQLSLYQKPLGTEGMCRGSSVCPFVETQNHKSQERPQSTRWSF